MAEAAAPPVEEEVELEWEEWDGKSPFLHHCIAGSIAGVAEHTLLYPIDTVKTHMQSYCADCPIPAQQAAAAASSSGGGRAGSSAAAALGPRACIKKVAAAGAGSSASTTSKAALESSITGMGATSPSLAEPGMKAAQHMTSPGTTARPVQHGMLSTMRNLMAHGHSNAYGLPPGAQPRLAHVSLASAGSAVAEGGPSRGAASAAAATVEIITMEASTHAADAGRGFARLWRGVQSVIYGCVPAHALYFSSYEAIKAIFQERQHAGHTSIVSTESNNLGPLGSSVAGASAAFCHDLIMSPLDTVKQRLQLGHYEGTGHAIRQIVRHEGFSGLYRSFPITLLTNLPYGMLMVSTNEYLREMLEKDPTKPPDVKTSLLAGSGAGMVAAAVTTPLDRVKTRLQTQRMGAAIAVTLQENQGLSCDKALQAAVSTKGSGAGCPKARAEGAMLTGSLGNPKYGGLSDAFKSIIKEEGTRGLFRGITPRLLTHTPAVAISWTAYEAAKQWLASAFPVHS